MRPRAIVLAGMRRATAVSLLLVSFGAPALAQGIIGGFAVEQSSGRPLRCVNVFLLDTLGTVVDSTRTRRGGLFQLMAPADGRFRVRFSAGGITDVHTELEPIAPDAQIERQFRIPLYLDSATLAFIEGRRPAVGKLRLRRGSPEPRYPPALQRAELEGEVVLAFAVDDKGVVDTATVLPLRISHAQFFRAVNEVLPRSRYDGHDFSPGVECVLAIQPFHFRMGRE